MKDRSLIQRIALGISGQATFRAVVALGSLLVIPALIRGWGVRGYGEWIALTALTSYMSYSNFGVVSTSMNEMIMASGAGDYRRATRVFQMSINLAAYIIAPILILVAIIMAMTPVSGFMKFEFIAKSDVSVIFTLVAIQVWLLTLRGILIAVLYAGGSYGFVYYLVSGTKLAEFLVVAVGVGALGFRPIDAAMVMAGIALLEVVIIAICAARAASWMKVDLRAFEWSWVANQAKPSFGFLLSNFAAQGILLQGARIVLSALLGGSAVAVYAIYGTAMRFTDQLLLMVVLPLEVEIAHSLGRSNPDRTRRLVVLGTQISWILFVGVAAFLMLSGPMVFGWWTNGRIQFSYGLMGLYLTMSAANLLGRVSAHALTSTNRMYGPSFGMVAAALFALCLGGLLTIPFKIQGMVVGGIVGELGNSLIALWATAILLDRSAISLLAEMLDFRTSYSDLKERAYGLYRRVRPA